MVIKFKILPVVALGLCWIAGGDEARSWVPGIQGAYDNCRIYELKGTNGNKIAEKDLAAACEKFRPDPKAYNTCCSGDYNNSACKLTGQDKLDVGRCGRAAGSADYQCNNKVITPLCK